MAAVHYTNDPLVYNTASGGNADSLTAAYTLQAFPLYMYREENGAGYKFVKFDASSVAITAGMIVYWKGTTMDGIVTAKVSDSTKNQVAGVTNVARADTTYGWIQVTGIATNVVSDGGNDGVRGDQLVALGNGTADTMTAGTAPTTRSLGVVLASEAASLFPSVYLTLRD
jgi:hypothetical protein